MAYDKQRMMEPIYIHKTLIQKPMAADQQCVWETGLITEHLSATCALLLLYLFPREPDEAYTGHNIPMIRLLVKESK